MSNPNIAPCVECPVRRVTETFDCRTVCWKYRNFREMRDERNRKEAEDSIVKGYMKDTQRKFEKRANRK